MKPRTEEQRREDDKRSDKLRCLTWLEALVRREIEDLEQKEKTSRRSKMFEQSDFYGKQARVASAKLGVLRDIRKEIAGDR
jgi:hypothetical protein